MRPRRAGGGAGGAPASAAAPQLMLMMSRGREEKECIRAVLDVGYGDTPAWSRPDGARSLCAGALGPTGADEALAGEVDCLMCMQTTSPLHRQNQQCWEACAMNGIELHSCIGFESRAGLFGSDLCW